MASIRVVLAVVGLLVAMILALPVLAVGLPIWITALAVRGLARRLEPLSVRWSDVIEFDAGLGWRPKANLDVYCLNDRDDVFRVRTGADGWHGRTLIEECDVVVVGDSHAFGFGIDADASFASVLPRPRIKALGAPGYNMVQELLVMREVAAKLSGKLVVWFVYPGNDLYDNIQPSMRGYRAPFVGEDDRGYHIVTEHVSAEKWTASVGRGGEAHCRALAALYAPTYLGNRAYGAAEFLIVQGAELCRSISARLVVMVIPSPDILEDAGRSFLKRRARDPESFDPGFVDRRIGDACSRAGIGFVPLTAYLDRSHFLPHDDHWTEAGHRVVARAIASAFETFGQR